MLPNKIKIKGPTTHDQVALEWSAYTAGTNEATITGYSIDIAVANSGSGEATGSSGEHKGDESTTTSVVVNDPLTTAFTVVGLSPATAYCFRICAINEVGNGPSCKYR